MWIGDFPFLNLFLVAILKRVNSEAFCSTANLIQLVKSEKEFVSNLETIIQEEEDRLQEVRRYIDEIKSKAAAKESDSLQYAGHPVNAFNLIKRWYRLSTMTPYTKDHAALKKQFGQLPVPSQDDYKGALAAIVRLQRTFALKTDDVHKGKIMGEEGMGEMTTEDCHEIAVIAFRNNEYRLAAEWFEKVIEHPQGNLPDADTFLYLTRALEKTGNISQAAHYAKLAVLKDEGQDAELIANSERLQEEVSNPSIKVNKTWGRNDKFGNVDQQSQDNYERLCRGDLDALKDPEYAKDLVCKYRAGVLPYVVYKEEVLCWSPRIGMFYEVISDREAEMIKRKAYPLLNRGMVGNIDSSHVSRNRISKVAWLWDEDPEIKYISERVKDCTGLETQYRNPLSSAEPFQVVNYGIGGQYEPHHDFSSAKNTKYPDYLQNTGERLATFLFYLTDVKHGGATVFPKVNVRVPPIKNAAAFWYNAGLSGKYDTKTQHAGCPVLLGQKWVSNKWIREYGQEFRRKCGLTKDAVDMS